jgi:hypothetical protein
MTLSLLLALQAAPAPPPAAPLPVDFDLAQVRPGDDCRREGGAEIIVCGRRPGRGDYDFEKWEKVFAEKPIVAELGIGGGAVARAYAESVDMPQGQVSKRIMVGIKLPF